MSDSIRPAMKDISVSSAALAAINAVVGHPGTLLIVSGRKASGHNLIATHLFSEAISDQPGMGFAAMNEISYARHIQAPALIAITGRNGELLNDFLVQLQVMGPRFSFLLNVEDRRDIEAIKNLAASGHSVIATVNAVSRDEALGKIGSDSAFTLLHIDRGEKRGEKLNGQVLRTF